MSALKDILLSKRNAFKSLSNGDLNLSILYQLLSYFKVEGIQNEVKELYSKIVLDNIQHGQYHELHKLMVSFKNNETLKSLILNDWDTIIYKLFETAWSDEEYKNIPELFEAYGMDYDNFIENENDSKYVQEFVDQYLSETTDNFVRSSVKLSDFYEEEKLLDEIYNKVEYEIQSLTDELGIEFPDDLIDYNGYWEETESARYSDWDDNDYRYNYSPENSTIPMSETQLIDNLFDR